MMIGAFRSGLLKRSAQNCALRSMVCTNHFQVGVQSFSQNAHELDFSNGETAFKSMTNMELVRAYGVFALCTQVAYFFVLSLNT